MCLPCVLKLIKNTAIYSPKVQVSELAQSVNSL